MLECAGGTGEEGDAFGELGGDLGDDVTGESAGDDGALAFAHDEGVAAEGDGVVEDFGGDVGAGDVDGEDGDACFAGHADDGAESFLRVGVGFDARDVVGDDVDESEGADEDDEEDAFALAGEVDGVLGLVSASGGEHDARA